MTPDPHMQPQFYAGTPTKRLIAWILDMMLIVVICILILPFTGFTGIFVFPFLMLMVGFIYRWSTLTNGSATWGMRLMALELRDAQDRPLDATSAGLHTLGYSISFSIPVLQLISIVLMLTSERRQGLTDIVLGTVALNRRR
ncbi:MAG: RDD family protein [Sulfitobacter sp.]